MSIMNLSIHGKEYQIACDDGQEAHLGALAQQFNERLSQIARSTGRIQESTLMVLGALMMADELHELQNKNKLLEKRNQQLEMAQHSEENATINAEKMAEHREMMEQEFAGIIDKVSQRIQKISSKIEAVA